MGLFSWLKRNGEVDTISAIIRREVEFRSVAYWDDSVNKYIWGYGTDAKYVDGSVDQNQANYLLRDAVRIAIDHFKHVFRYFPSQARCPVCKKESHPEISITRTRALVRLIVYMGEHRFDEMKDVIQAVHGNDWEMAAWKLREYRWYEKHGHRARCIVRELRDDSACFDPEETK